MHRHPFIAFPEEDRGEDVVRKSPQGKQQLPERTGVGRDQGAEEGRQKEGCCYPQARPSALDDPAHVPPHPGTSGNVWRHSS